MTVSLWRIATDTSDYEADDLGGKGAEITGGRWNRPGLPVVYASCSIALACLETMAHLNASDLPLNRFLVRIDVPDDCWTARRMRTPEDLPVGWTAIPEGRVSLDIGDTWLKSGDSALLAVPSVIVPEECNVLINPRHPDAKGLRATKLRPWHYDGGLRHGQTGKSRRSIAQSASIVDLLGMPDAESIDFEALRATGFTRPAIFR